METFVEALYKSADKLQLGWNPEPIPVTNVKCYKLYVGQVSSILSLLADNISPQKSQDPQTYAKIAYNALIADVRSLLGIGTSYDFSNLVLYFALTYVNASNVESAQSRVSEVTPVGVMGKTRKEDPTVNRFMFGFSDNIQRWVKLACSANGGLITSSSDFYAPNTITEYTRDSSGNVLTEKVYWADRTSAGSPAKITTYAYSGAYISKVTTTDSTV